MDLLAMTVNQRQNWLRAVEAACRGIPLSLTYNELSADTQLDEDIQVEYEKLDTDVPENLKHLVQQKLSKILNMNFYQQKKWLRSIRAAHGISKNRERQTEQISDDTYEPERKFLRQWMATGRY